MVMIQSWRALLSAGLLMGLVATGTGAAEETPIMNPHGGPAAAAVPPATVIARFNGEAITAGDLDAAIAGISGPERLEYATPEPLHELVDALVDRKLMARAARKAGLDRDPAVRSQLDQTPAASPPEQVLAEAYLERELRKVPVPTQQQIGSYYREHQAEFTVPARVRVTRVVTATKATAERLRADLAQGATVQQIRENDPAHTVLLDSIWIHERPRMNEMEAIALGLKPGQASPVLETDTGFAALRVEEAALARLRPLTEVRNGVLARLQDEQRQAALAGIRGDLRKGLTVQIEEDALVSYAGAARDR
jgi:peptidyl-prolyl cis-trans isomerase C